MMLRTKNYPINQPTNTRPAFGRLDSIDIVRGLAMVFMLLNHSSWHIPGLELDANHSWYDPTPVQQIRSPEAWLSILQGTPMFFVLAGFSLAFFERSRQKRKWSEWEITRYLLIRGNVLILIDFIIPGFALSSIGMCLWLIAFLRRVPIRQLIVLALGLTLAMQLAYETVTIPRDFNIVRSILLYPGPADPTAFGYPVLQWVAVVILGYISGRYAINHRHNFADYALKVGLLAFAVWLVTTLDDQFGRLFRSHPFVLTKHPPSLAYLSLYMGFTFTLLSIFTRLQAVTQSAVFRFLALLGQVEFFFYVTHFLVIQLISAVIVHLPMAPLTMNFVVMTVALAVLFPICRAYRAVRQKHPDSVLQYL